MQEDAIQAGLINYNAAIAACSAAGRWTGRWFNRWALSSMPFPNKRTLSEKDVYNWTPQVHKEWTNVEHAL